MRSLSTACVMLMLAMLVELPKRLVRSTGLSAANFLYAFCCQVVSELDEAILLLSDSEEQEAARGGVLPSLSLSVVGGDEPLVEPVRRCLLEPMMLKCYGRYRVSRANNLKQNDEMSAESVCYKIMEAKNQFVFSLLFRWLSPKYRW